MKNIGATRQLARWVYCEKALPAQQLEGLHVMQQEVAGFYLTESVFPPGFHLPRHSHQYHCVYLVLNGSFTETEGSKNRIRKRFDVVLTPLDQPHSDTFHEAGGRCFFVEIPSGWAKRVREYSTIWTAKLSFKASLCHGP